MLVVSPKRATTGTTAIFISPRNKARRWCVRDVGETQCVSDVPDATGSGRFEIHGCTGMFGGLAVFSELTVEFGCPRRPVAPSNREFPLP